MTQTTETTQQATAETTQTTSQTATTTATATAPQPEQTAQQTKPQQTSQQPTATPPPAPKSVFLSNGELSQIAITPEEAEKTTIKATSEAPSEADDLKAQLTALQARLDAIESQRTTETRTAEVERLIAPLSDTLKAVYRRTPFVTLTDDEFAQLRETISKEVTELATADKARGAVFSRPTASKPTDGKASDKETDEVLRRLNL